MSRMTRIVVPFPPDVLEALGQLSTARRLSICEVVRQAVYAEIHSTTRTSRRDSPAAARDESPMVDTDYDFGA